ncbi:MAG: chromate resistance protein ChrB domain-containing protein, partial [Methyloceanibacter sp.]
MTSPTAITVSQLSRLVGTPAAPLVIDFSSDDDFKADPRLIPSSFRLSLDQVPLLAPEIRGSKVVAVCRDGKTLSQGAAALLRAQGISTENLEGGKLAWRDAGEPLVPWAKLPKVEGGRQTLWVTRQRPKIDRIACPWLIRRFVDARARFLFVAPAEVLSVAARLDATPFDVEGV